MKEKYPDDVLKKNPVATLTERGELCRYIPGIRDDDPWPAQRSFCLGVTFSEAVSMSDHEFDERIKELLKTEPGLSKSEVGLLREAFWDLRSSYAALDAVMEETAKEVFGESLPLSSFSDGTVYDPSDFVSP